MNLHFANLKGASRSPFSLLEPSAKRTVIAYAIAVVLSCTWLLPNHYHPWIAFHSDFYIASAFFGVLAWRLATCGKRRILVSSTSLVLLFLSVICLLQYFVGLTYFHGEAVIASMYFIGASLATILGIDFASRDTELLRKLFAAILAALLIAGITSVGISLYQYFALTYLGIWVIPSMSARFAANMGQPNQLATLISCAICVAVWFFERRKLGLLTLCALVAWLLVGTIMTESRTGFVQLGIIAVAWCVVPSRSDLRQRTALLLMCVVWFFSVTTILGFVAQSLGLSLPFGSREMRPDPVRLALWQDMLNAVLIRPWIGYGSSGFHEAYWIATAGNPALEARLFGHAHNIFIDLAIWFGIPVAVLLGLGFLGWILRAIRYVKWRQYSWLLVILAIIFLHAMLELPLHYAYYLLPFMLLVGYLERRSHALLFSVNKAIISGLVVVAGAAGSIIWIDYMDAEEAFRIFRFESARIGNVPDVEPSPALLVNQWQLVIAAARMSTEAIQNEKDFDLMIGATKLQPAPHFFLKSAEMLTQRGRHKEAENAIRYGCHVNPAIGCTVLKHAWEEKQKRKPENMGVSASHAVSK